MGILVLETCVQNDENLAGKYCFFFAEIVVEILQEEESDDDDDMEDEDDDEHVKRTGDDTTMPEYSEDTKKLIESKYLLYQIQLDATKPDLYLFILKDQNNIKSVITL